jgi:hypothetical protein
MELVTPDVTDEDADPHPGSALYVPVRLGSAGRGQLRLARSPLGERTAIGFTSRRRLTSLLGERQPWIRLAEPALRALAEPLGAATVTVDPCLTEPAGAPGGRRTAPAQPCARRSRDLLEAMSR